ncbi:MAG: hypothetical protein IPH28_19090 [Cytophagaceae bacterium]|nr:hypothetical protein [Cytophagaceae bacterium]
MYKILFLSLFFFLKNAVAQVENIKLPVAHSIRAMDVSPDGTFWISGSKGAIYKLEGKSWVNYCPSEFKDYDFRGISILSKTTLITMSAGEGENGKAFLLKSTDAGKNWKKVFQDSTKGAFFDTIKFLHDKDGWLLGDQIGGKPYLRKTSDGGETWQNVETDLTLFEGEASFAASNSCIALNKKNVWFTTQNRIFFSKNKGKSWKILTTPFVKTESKGIFGIFFKDSKNGIAVGGDYLNENEKTLQLAITTDGGNSWDIKNQEVGQGVSESVVFVNNKLMVISGTKGIVLKDIYSKKSIKISDGIFHVIKCHSNSCIAAGAGGNTCFFEINPNLLQH